MEKKVLLKDLVDFGTHVRKQITSKVRVSDQGVYPIGEIWDANTVVDVIVNGAHDAHDTIRELDEYTHHLDNVKANKADVYTKTEVDNIIGDLGMRYFERSMEFDYIHDEESWNNSYQNGGLKLYYAKYPDEDRWNVQENRPARATDKNPDGTWDDTKCPQCWQGAINAPGAKYPWIVPYFTRDVNSKLIFKYDGKEDVMPWGDAVFGVGDGRKQWGCASIPVEFNDDSFDIKGQNLFDINKFKMILEYQVPVPYTVKTYIDDHMGTGGSYIIGDDTVGTNQIIDGSILLDDLSTEVKQKLQATIDEDDENATIFG